ncbi:MAG TPA: LssY C-terminal domain-containing protein [Oscillatoriaceae cyanobacterium]
MSQRRAISSVGTLFITASLLLSGCGATPQGLPVKAMNAATAQSVEPAPTWQATQVALPPEVEAAAASNDLTFCWPWNAEWFHTWEAVITSIITGRRKDVPGTMPPYPTLDPALVQAAEARGQGRVEPALYVSGNPQGTQPLEPGDIIVTGTRAQLTAALRATGWIEVQPHTNWNLFKLGLSVMTRFWNDQAAPVSHLYYQGRQETLAFEKDSDYVLSRDHMRVYPLPADSTTGSPRWMIAASRDVAITVCFKHPSFTGWKIWKIHWPTPDLDHHADLHTDGERALVLLDLLKSPQLKGWDAVHATPSTGPQSPYQTDGEVFELTLGG